MKFQAIVLASFLVMPYALADDQGGLKTGCSATAASCNRRWLSRNR